MLLLHQLFSLCASQSTLWDAHGIKTVRRTLADVAALGKIESDGTLRIGDDVVSVVYFRAGCVHHGVGLPYQQV